MTQADRRTLLVGGSALVGGIILGGVVGAVLGLLLAPQAGKDTREDLRAQAGELADAIKDTSEALLKVGKRQVSAVRQCCDTVTRHAKHV